MPARETITLDITTPKTNLSGFDAAIGRMRQMEQLHEKLNNLGPITLKFATTGAEGVEKVAKDLSALSTEVKGKLAQLNAEMANFSKQTGAVQAEVKSSTDAMTAQAQATKQAGEQMGKTAKQGEGLFKAQSDMNAAVEAGNDGLMRRGLLLKRVVSDGEKQLSVTRKFQVAPGETQSVTGKLTTSDLNIVDRYKQDLAQVGEQLRGQRRDAFDAGAVKNSQQQIDLLKTEASQRTAILEKMKAAGLEATSTFQEEQKRVSTLRAQAAAQELTNANQKKATDEATRAGIVKNTLAGQKGDLDRETKQLTSEAKTREELVKVLQKQAQGYADLAKSFDAAGSGGSAGQRAALGESSKLNAQATQAQQGIDTDKLSKSLATQRSLLDADTKSMQAQVSTREEMVGVLHRQAQGYRDLSEAYKSAGQEGTAKQLSSQKESARLTTEAQRLERELQGERSRTAQLTQTYQQQVANFGGRQRTVRNVGEDGSTVVTRATRETSEGLRESIEFTRRFDAAGKELTPTLKSVSDQLSTTGRAADAAGKSFFDNIATVTAWAAAVAVLYKSLQLLEFGVTSTVKLEYEQTRLGVLFRNFGSDAGDYRDQLAKLNDATLMLAVANGRSGAEAEDAAIRWARLGLNAKDTLEAVDVSLKAANVAEITTAEAAEQLAAVFAAYRLEVGQLRTVLNELNTISNTYNVTNKDLLAGLARSSAIARQAGLGFSELIGIIGAGVGRTGRSGAEIGNAIKSIIVSVSNPKIQEFLLKGFNFDVRGDDGKLKDFSTILNELYIRFQNLENAERQELLQKVAGKQQASRLNAILDGYVQSQVLAIQAQRNLNSAELENNLIRTAAQSQLESLSTAFQRFGVNLAQAGRGKNIFTDVSILGNFTEVIKVVTHFLELLGSYPKVTALIALALGVMTIRLVRTGLAMQDGTTKGNLLTRSLTAVRNAFIGLENVLDRSNSKLATNTAQMNANSAAAQKNAAAQVGAGAAAAGGGVARTAGAAAGAAGRAGGLARVGRLGLGLLKGVGLAIFSPEMLAITAAIYLGELAFKGINKAIDGFKGGIDDAAKRLGVYNIELEKTRSEIGAFEQAQRLAKTLGSTIGVTATKDLDAAKQQLTAFSSIAFTNTQDGSGEQRKKLRDELLGMLYTDRANGYKNLGNRLDEVGKNITQEKVTYSKQALALEAKANETREQSVNALQNEINAKRASGEDTKKQEEDLGKLLGEIEESRKKIIEGVEDTTDLVGNETESFSKYREELAATLKDQLKNVGDVFKALPTVDDKGKSGYERDLQTLEAKLEFLDAIAKKDQDVADQEQKNAEANAKPYVDRANALQRSPQGQRIQDRLNILQGLVDADQYSDKLKAENSERTGQPSDFNLRTNRDRAALENYRQTQAAELLHLHDLAADELGIMNQQVTAAKVRNTEQQKQIKLQRDSVEEEKKKKEAEAPFTAVRGAAEEGVADAKKALDELKVGRDEFAQTMNQLQAIGSVKINFDDPDQSTGTGIVRELLDRRRADQGGEKRSEQARIEGQLFEVMAFYVGGVNKLLEDQSKIKSELINKQAKLNEEASKGLLLADREDQVRAALLKKFLNQNGGKFSANEFEFFDKGTKEAANKFFPGATPVSDDETIKLKQELATLNEKLGGLQQVAESFQEFSGKIKPVAFDLGVDNGRIPQLPTVPNINIQLAEQGRQYIDLVTKAVTGQMQSALAIMRADLDRLLHGNGAGVGAAQQAAADSIH